MRITGSIIIPSSNTNYFSGVVKTGFTTGVRNNYNFLLGRSRYGADSYYKTPKNTPTGQIWGYGLIQGLDTPSSTVTGWLNWSGNINLFETFHGKENSGIKYNYYQAFYPGGYFSPPYGENTSLLEIPSYMVPEGESEVRVIQEPDDSFLLNGGCAPMNLLEYHQKNGILSKTSAWIGTVSSQMSADVATPIKYPYEDCPQDISIPYYFDEFGLMGIAGFTGYGVGGLDYNDNPIPTSLDFDNFRILDSKGISTVTPSSSTNVLNNILCPAWIMETDISFGRGTNSINLHTDGFSQMIDASNETISFADNDEWAIWHFAFRENAEYMPFKNSYPNNSESSRLIGEGMNKGIEIETSTRGGGEGTQIFKPSLASEGWFWEHRQCPETIDFLPWTFGGTLTACPSDHFDIPYYAAINRFGFYGTRFQSRCQTLDTGLNRNFSTTAWGNFEDFDLLLSSAKNEEKYASLYADNKAFLLWANYPVYKETRAYQIIAANPKFQEAFSGVMGKYFDAFGNETNNFLKCAPQLKIHTNLGIYVSYPSTGISGLKPWKISDKSWFTDSDFIELQGLVQGIFSGEELDRWNYITSGYTKFVVTDFNGTVNKNFYDSIQQGKEARTHSRYLYSISNGQSIDLFPYNKITFSFDNPTGYTQGQGWVRRASSVGSNTSDLPDISRRYFHGNYGKSNIRNIQLQYNSFITSNVTGFILDDFRNRLCGSELPKGTFVDVTQASIKNTILNKTINPSGWMMLGYNEIGKLDGNFSCFTPLIIQEPVNVSCKLGQKPVFRVDAVDYHTLPEDKITNRWREISYWAKKLKLLDTRGNLIESYKLKNFWLRVPNAYADEVKRGDLTHIEYPNPTGNWSYEEFNVNGKWSKTCTLIHPSLSDSENLWNHGSVLGDNGYQYFSIIVGRFGVRRSELVSLNVENWVLFDVSLRVGADLNGSSLSIQFDGTDSAGNTVQATATPVLSTKTAGFDGFIQDKWAIPEEVIEEGRPPSNAGYCDGTKFRMTGPMGYRGETRSWAPPTLLDTRGLSSKWGHASDYGKLIQFEMTLNQAQGNMLYNGEHLPACLDAYQGIINPKQKGVKITAKIGDFEIRNWAIEQKAGWTNNGTQGIVLKRLYNIGELFPPIIAKPSIVGSRSESLAQSVRYGIGHWQFGNNLGAIKDIQQPIYSDVPNSIFPNEKWEADTAIKKFFNKTDLIGKCGYNPSSLGRNMLYFNEAYERFYIMCDPIKKKNIKNLSFISPGLRFTNSAIQYFWLGQPYNTYLERLPMYGPYAYQWKVNRHNRDRNGNGIPISFYSMGWGQKYSLMYDMPAVYGLYLKKTKIKDSKAQDVILHREAAFIDGANILDIRNSSYGKRRGGSCKGFGSVQIQCEKIGETYPTEIEGKLCEWIDSAKSFAGSPTFSDYYCHPEDLAKGACFDPCLSIRYDQGFFPGGKRANLLGNLNNGKSLRLTYDASHKDDGSNGDELEIENARFRGPAWTPYAKKRGVDTSITPCGGNGADHCNYITAMVSVGDYSYLMGDENEYNNIAHSIYALFT